VPDHLYRTRGGLRGPCRRARVIAPFQIHLALAVGWMGLWLIRSDNHETRPSQSRVAAIA
jgi:hypothetical protein